jgi:uncharacterized protein
MTHRHPGRVIAGLLAAAALGGAAAQGTTTTTTSTVSPAKKELVQRVLRVQQGDIDAIARSLVEQPAARMLQEAGLAVQQLQMPQDKATATMRQIEVEVKKYVDDALPPVRERATKIAPSTIGTALETKMSDDELKLLLAWLESPTAKKFQQVGSEARNNFVQQVLRDAGPLVQPKLQALDGRIRVILGVPPLGADSGAGAAPGTKAPGK